MSGFDRLPAPSRVLQRKPDPVTVSHPEDASEREADRAADSVTRGSARGRGLSLSRIAVAPLQREEKPGEKTNEEKQQEALKKIAEAFLATEAGKKVKDIVEQDKVVQAGKDFVSTLSGKVITGAVAAGAIAGLGAAGKELPVPLPEIPLDIIQPGLKTKITWEGPVASPTKATITFTYSAPAVKSKGGQTASEKYRDETAKIAEDQRKFREGMKYPPGSPEDLRQKAEEDAARKAAFGRVGQIPGIGSGLKLPDLTTGPALPEPSFGFKKKPIRLLEGELELKPMDELTPGAAKKKDEGGVQRKAAGPSAVEGASPLVHETLSSAGQPLDAHTRGAMESRFGYDFSHVRIHTDTRAEESARSVDAVAYTAGPDVVFGRGSFSPNTPAGRHLIAHELAHVVQQTGAAPAFAPPVVQRRSIFESIGIFLGFVEGNFSDDELIAYLDKITHDQKIEDSYDSDNKARAITRKWKANDTKFNLVAAQKYLLIKEMLSGPTLDDDENAILDLLEFSDNVDLRIIMLGIGLANLESDIHGDERKRLDLFVEARFEDGRDAVLKNDVRPKGAAPKGAPKFPFSWPVLRLKIETSYSVEDIVNEISAYDPALREQVLQMLVDDRVARERKSQEFYEKYAAEKDPKVQAQIEKEGQRNGGARRKTDVILEHFYKDIALSETKASLKKTTKPTAAQKAEIKKALAPDVKVSSGGAPLPFVDTLPGEKQNYEQKLRAMLPTLIQGYYDSMVKDKGKAEHDDPTKVRSLKEFEDLGNFAKDETDAVFGQFKKGAALKADTPKKRGNIHDLFADLDKSIAGMTPDNRRALARQLMFYFFQSDDSVRSLNHDHNATPEFDADQNPVNAVAKSLDKLATEFTATDAQVRKLNEIDRGWDASANPRTGDINIQIFKPSTVAKDRDFMWDMFQTLIHEYMHTLAHATYSAHAISFGASSNQYNTLIEGMDCVLSESVWTHFEPKANDKDVREKVEGKDNAKLPPIKIPPPSQRRYPSFAEALKLVSIVGIRNVYAAYFLGDTKKIGA